MSNNKSVNRLFLAVIVIYIGVSLGFGILASYFPILGELPVYVNILLSQALIFLPGLAYCRHRGIAIREFIPYRRINFATAILVVICTYLMYPMIIVLNAISMLFTNTGTAAVADLMQGQSFLLSVLFVAGMPAFVEEFMFRGVLFHTYRKSRMLSAILLSAFLFGCMHMNLNQFMYAFALGVYLAFLVEATGSILSSMLAHFTLNVTSVVLSFLLPVLSRIAGVEELSQAPQIRQGGYAAVMESNELLVFLMGIIIWAIIAVGTTCGAVGIYYAICRINGRWEHVKQMFRGGSREHMVTVPLVIGIGIAFAFMGLSIITEMR